MYLSESQFALALILLVNIIYSAITVWQASFQALE